MLSSHSKPSKIWIKHIDVPGHDCACIPLQVFPWEHKGRTVWYWRWGYGFLTLSSLSQQLSSARSGRQVRPERAEESCWLTVNGRYDMLVFVGNAFSWWIQIWNRYINILSSVWVRIYADSDCKVLISWKIQQFVFFCIYICTLLIK